MNTYVRATTAVKHVVRQYGLVALLSLMSGSLFAQQAPLKIAVLDMSTALFNSDIAKEVDKQVRDETSSDEQTVRSLAEQATGLQEKLKKDGSIMSESEQRKAAEKIEEIGVQYQFLVQKIQKLVQERRQQFQQTYAPNLVKAITEVVEEDDFDIVFRSEVALHYRSSYDITARVTEKLNQQK